MKSLARLLIILSSFIVFTFTAHSDENTQTPPASNAQMVIEEAEEEPECD